MTPIQYITKSDAACATSSEVIAMSRVSKADLETLKAWAREEMTNRGIAIDEAVLVVAEKQ